MSDTAARRVSPRVSKRSLLREPDLRQPANQPFRDGVGQPLFIQHRAKGVDRVGSLHVALEADAELVRQGVDLQHEVAVRDGVYPPDMRRHTAPIRLPHIAYGIDIPHIRTIGAVSGGIGLLRLQIGQRASIAS